MSTQNPYLIFDEAGQILGRLKTAAEHEPTKYIQSDHTRTPEPRIRWSWSSLRRLRWHASLIMADHPGVVMYVEKGRGFRETPFSFGQFLISYPNGGMHSRNFDEAREVLTGIRIGLEISARLDAEKLKLHES
jgi:hypothetical protein